MPPQAARLNKQVLPQVTRPRHHLVLIIKVVPQALRKTVTPQASRTLKHQVEEDPQIMKKGAMTAATIAGGARVRKTGGDAEGVTTTTTTIRVTVMGLLTRASNR